MKEPHKLTHNYRSHTGVLRLASAVDVIYDYFPDSIDRLEPDRGLFPGPKPKLCWLSHSTCR